MFERFGKATIEAILMAQEEAASNGQSFVNAEHLLLGSIAATTGSVAQLLQEKGINLVATRTFLRELTSCGDTANASNMPFSAEAKKVLEHAWNESRKLGQTKPQQTLGSIILIEPEHLLLGVLIERSNVALSVLQRFGVQNVDEFSEEILKALSNSHRTSNIENTRNSHHQKRLELNSLRHEQPNANSKTETRSTGLFERFSQSTISVVMIAQEFAQEMKFDKIDADALLYGLLVEHESSAAKLLLDSGLSVARLLKALKGVMNTEPASAFPEIPFSDRSQKVLLHGKIVAEKHGSKIVEPIHLLFALVNWTDTIPIILIDAGADLQEIKRELAKQLEQIDTTIPESGPDKTTEQAPKALHEWFSKSSIRVIARAEERARIAGYSLLTTEILLAELLKDAEWIPQSLMDSVLCLLSSEERSFAISAKVQPEVEFSQEVLRIFMDARKDPLLAGSAGTITPELLLQAIFKNLETGEINCLATNNNSNNVEIISRLREVLRSHLSTRIIPSRIEPEPLFITNQIVRTTTRFMQILISARSRRNASKQSEHTMANLVLAVIEEARASEITFVQNREKAVTQSIESIQALVQTEDIVDNGRLRAIIVRAIESAKSNQSLRLDINHLALALLDENDESIDALLNALEGNKKDQTRDLLRRQLNHCLLTQTRRGYQIETGEILDIDKIEPWMQIEDLHARRQASSTQEDLPAISGPFSAELNEILANAAKISKANGSIHIQLDDLLLSLIQEKNGSSAAKLRSLGVDVEALLAKLTQRKE